MFPGSRSASWWWPWPQTIDQARDLPVGQHRLHGRCEGGTGAQSFPQDCGGDTSNSCHSTAESVRFDRKGCISTPLATTVFKKRLAERTHGPPRISRVEPCLRGLVAERIVGKGNPRRGCLPPYSRWRWRHADDAVDAEDVPQVTGEGHAFSGRCGPARNVLQKPVWPRPRDAGQAQLLRRRPCKVPLRSDAPRPANSRIAIPLHEVGLRLGLTDTRRSV